MLALASTCILFSIVLFSCAGGPAVPSPQEYFELGKAYQGLKKYDEAKKWYTRALSSPITGNAARYQLGRIAWEEKAYEASLDHFLKILEEDPDNSMVLRSAAYAALELSRIELSESLYARLLALVPDSRDEQYNYVIVLLRLERYERAKEVFEHWLQGTRADGNAVLLSARIYRGLGEPQAIDLYEEWLVENSTNARVRREYALLLSQSKFYAKALEQYETLLKMEKPEQHGLSHAQILFEKALILADAGDDGAAEALDKAIAASWDDEEAILLLNTRLGRDPEAIEAAREAKQDEEDTSGQEEQGLDSGDPLPNTPAPLP